MGVEAPFPLRTSYGRGGPLRLLVGGGSPSCVLLGRHSPLSVSPAPSKEHSAEGGMVTSLWSLPLACTLRVASAWVSLESLPSSSQIEVLTAPLDAGLLLGATDDDRDQLVCRCLLCDPLSESTVLHPLLLIELPFPLSHVDLLVCSQHHCPGCGGEGGGCLGGRAGRPPSSWAPSPSWAPSTWGAGDHVSPSVLKGALPLSH